MQNGELGSWIKGKDHSWYMEREMEESRNSSLHSTYLCYNNIIIVIKGMLQNILLCLMHTVMLQDRSSAYVHLQFK